MSDDILPNDFDHSLVKKRLVRELQIIVTVQIVALCVGLLFQYAFLSVHLIPDDANWDSIRLLCGRLALSCAIVFVITTFWGFSKIIYAGFTSDLMTTYFLGAWIVLVAFFLLSPSGGWPPIYFAIFICCFSFYCIIPQFFVARWLARKAEEDVQIEGLPEEKSGDWE